MKYRLPQDTKDEENPAVKTVSGLEETIFGLAHVEEVEISFDTKFVNGIDTIFDRRHKSTYSGKMIILNDLGKVNGELEVSKWTNGRRRTIF